jgi:glyoxylase-like metal-dependent hydrolase (beta-lactamase superfamily II)
MHVHVLEIKFDFNGKQDALYPVMLADQQELLLVDCGYEGFMPLIGQAALSKGISLSNLTGILITHHDLDHMGGLAELKATYPHLKVYASAIQEKYISGKDKSLRLVQAEKMYASLPEEFKPGALLFQEMLRNMKAVEVDYTVPVDDPLPFMQLVQVLATPGHMPGHISLYLKESKTLVAADALVYENGSLEIANPQFTLDLPEAVRTVEKLRKMDIETLICYHGGVLKGGVTQQLSQLASRYKHVLTSSD